MRCRRMGLLALLGGPTVAACSGELGPTPPERSDDTNTSRQAVFNKSFGIHSTVTYQNNWQGSLDGSDTALSRMIGVLDDAANYKYWYNLVGKQYYWHDTGDQAANSLEDVDMFVDFTHGGATTNAHSEWAMWNDPVKAASDQMRLGDEAVGLSVFTQVSCETLKFDAYTWTRWDSVFRGGLRAALGSHDLFMWGGAEYDVLKVFAQYLNAGNTLKTSWAAGWDLTIYDNQDVAVMFTGVNQSNCELRRDNMRWSDFASYSKLQDGSITSWCGWMWDNI